MFFKRLKFFSQIFCFIFLFFFNFSFAINNNSEGYKIPANGTVDVSSRGYYCSTTSSSSVFIGTKTTSEWNSFLNNKPSYITCTRYCNDDTTDYTAWASTGICNANGNWNQTRSRTATNCIDVQAKTATFNSCWYCSYPNTAADSTQCNNRGTVYTYCQSSYTWNGWQFPCACNTDYYGNNCESKCDYGDWNNQYCQSNGTWYATRTVTGSNCAGGPVNTNNGACWYCNSPAGTHIGDYDAGGSTRATRCSSSGTSYDRYRCSGGGNYVYYELSYCSCDGDRYGASCESACSYGGWSETGRTCQTNNQWYISYSREVTGSNCVQSATTVNSAAGTCARCSGNISCPGGWTGYGDCSNSSISYPSCNSPRTASSYSSTSSGCNQYYSRGQTLCTGYTISCVNNNAVGGTTSCVGQGNY